MKHIANEYPTPYNEERAKYVYNKGMDYYLGENGERKDLESALRYFDEGADMGDVASIYALSEMHYAGEGTSIDMYKAFHYMQEAADNNFPNAQYRLGNMFYRVDGAKKDIYQAIICWEQAGSNGYTDAYAALGEVYHNGTGVAIDYIKAYNYYTKANDNAEAQYNIASLYHDGLGVPQDYNKAYEWYSKSVAQGYVMAENNLAILLMEWTTSPQYYQNQQYSFQLFNRAAQKGHAKAYYGLGNCYDQGAGTSVNYDKAIECFTKAYSMGFEPAGNALKMYKKSLLGGYKRI